MKQDEKIHSFLVENRLDAILICGIDNLIYTHKISLPFAENYLDKSIIGLLTLEGDSTIICPYDWKEAIIDQGYIGDIKVYNLNKKNSLQNIFNILGEVIKNKNLHNPRIGFDESRSSKEFVEVMKKSLHEVNWINCDDELRKLRIKKTPEEIKNIETAAYQSELGIITALMHLEGTVDVPGYYVNEFTERVRVHIFEFGGSGVGHVATQVGSNSQMYYTPQRGTFKNGDIVRIDVTNHNQGYWSSAGRMAVIGFPNEIQSQCYENNLTLKGIATKMLKKGIRCDEIFRKVKDSAYENGIKFWEEVGIGHGIGVSHWEPPFLNAYDETELEAGMVIVLDVYTYGPIGELIHSKDIYEITDDEPRLLSWYKTWDKLYSVYGFRTTH